MWYLTQLTGLVFLALINGEIGGDCPPEHNDLVLDPPELIVQYGNSVSVSCRSLSNNTDLYWRISLENPDNQTFTWVTDSVTDYEIQPVCYMSLDNVTVCNRTLPIIVYKPPDQVSIKIVNHTGPVDEGRWYELQCDIQNVAPVHLLSVTWYKGPNLVKNINFTEISTKIPMSKSSKLHILPGRGDHGVQYRCEAKLNLGAEGSQQSPTITSGILNITLSSHVYNCSELVLDPPELVVRYGDPALVSCRSLSNHTNLGWRVPFGHVTNVNQTVIWKTDNLTDYEIQPVCNVTVIGVQCSKLLPIIVYKFPDQVSISIVNHTGPMTEGRNYELQCEVKNFAPVNTLAVSWYKGGVLLKNRGFTVLPSKIPSDKTVLLRITASKDEGEAPYSCLARLKLGPKGSQPSLVVKSNQLNVAVHYKPVINCSAWSPMINTSLNSYPHKFMGNPSPVITWHRDKSLVSTDMRLGMNDSGQYKYAASNVMGSTSCVTQITVEYAPTFACPVSYEGRENDPFSDKCSVRASPAANITWEKDGKMVMPLHKLTREDTGSYVITAVNKHGLKKHHLTINVLYGPEISLGLQDSVKEGEDVSLTCTAEGNPEPEVRWSFQSEIKVTGRQHTMLNITKASPADGGVYMCTATNDLGNNTRTVSLSVIKGCPIKLQPAKLVVEYGALASAVCSTTTTHNGIGWEASQGAVDMLEDVQSITWRVEHLTHWDIQPICYINVNNQCELRLPLTIYKHPDQVSISTVSHTGPMIEGRQYELQCDVRNVAPVHLLTVNWYKGQELVKSVKSEHPSSIFPVNISSTLWISTSKDDDGVQYRCEAELKLGPEGPQPPPTVSSDPLSITVHYKPVINCSAWSPMINTSLNLYPYKFMGNPSPVITWYQDKSLVSTDMRLGMKDSGQYKYAVSNVMGNTSCVTQITVEYAPTFECPAIYEGRENENDFSDNCSVRASPAANITWKKDGKMVMPLHKFTREDTGLYMITAVNKHGFRQHNVTINILYRPKVKLDNTQKSVKNGEDVSLICTAEGNPEPEVRWSFQNQIKTTGRRQTTLNITKATSADAGEYTCTATNELGRDTRNILLSVSESYIRIIIICCVVFLLVILIIICIRYLWLKRKRSGSYNIEGNGALHMSLLKQSDGKGVPANTENTS